MSGTYEPYPGSQRQPGQETPPGYQSADSAGPAYPPLTAYQPTNYPPAYRAQGYPQQPSYPQQSAYPGQSVSPVPPMALARSLVTDQRPPSTTELIVTWVVAGVTGLYMLPWAIAVTRGKANKWSTFAVNLLLGWTLIGWIAALVMSLTAHRAVSYGVPPGWYPSPDGVGRAYWDGVRWTQVLR